MKTMGTGTALLLFFAGVLWWVSRDEYEPAPASPPPPPMTPVERQEVARAQAEATERNIRRATGRQMQEKARKYVGGPVESANAADLLKDGPPWAVLSVMRKRGCTDRWIRGFVKKWHLELHVDGFKRVMCFRDTSVAELDVPPFVPGE